MALTKSFSVLFNPNSVPAGLTKSAPMAGDVVNCQSFYGGEITYKFTNSTAPTTNCTLTFQVSHDGTSWYDYYTVAGDIVAGSVNSGSIMLDRGVMYLRAIAYGNSTNAVMVEAHVQAVTGV